MFWEFLEKHFQFSLPLRSVTIRSLCHTARMVTLLRKESNEKFSWKAKIHSFSETQNVLRVSLKSLSVFVTFTEQSRMLRSVNKGTRQQARPPPCETKSNGRGGGAERRLNADAYTACDEHNHVAVCNFRGRLVDELILSLFTCSFERTDWC